MKKVQVIPATLRSYTKKLMDSQKKRRVAGYARVSTDHDEQLTSYEAQVDYYTRYIQSRNDWEFVGMYTDEGISATNTKHRKGFKRMIDDAMDGKIDLIITKSVSRFARNTVDSLTTIRKLKDKGVEAYFEKENIWTFDGKGELMLTGQLGDVMKESAMIAYSYVRAITESGKYKVDMKYFDEHMLHLHIPEGAVPKDGPSAGVTMTTALVSCFSEIPVKANLAMTGEVTLRGNVLPIGGLKEKSLAAHRSGIDTILIPKGNVKDLDDIPEEVKESVHFIPVSTVKQVLNAALVQ